MARITKAEAAAAAAAKAAQFERIEQVIRGITEDLGMEYANALGDYAARYGNGWPEQLTQVDWYHGQDANFRNSKGELVGHLLRQIRNHPEHGPAMYKAING